MKILYFTSTGNSLYVAKSLGGEVYSIAKMLKRGKLEFKDEKIGFVFPVYAMVGSAFGERVFTKGDSGVEKATSWRCCSSLMTYGN